MSLQGKTVLITGGARRIGRSLALAVAEQGASVVIHFNHSREAAEEAQAEIRAIGRDAHIVQADFRDPQAAVRMFNEARARGPIFALINNAAIFEHLTLKDTTLQNWDRHLAINLTAPFFLSQAFSESLAPEEEGRIVNLLDWRALRPGSDHLPYTISKAALVAVTQSLAIALAPQITVNGLALGAVLPPSDGADTVGILNQVPMRRWAMLPEVAEALQFLLEGPRYITGEVIHVDGGRHLV